MDSFSTWSSEPSPLPPQTVHIFARELGGSKYVDTMSGSLAGAKLQTGWGGGAQRCCFNEPVSLHREITGLEEALAKAEHSVSIHKEATQLLQTELQDVYAQLSERDDAIQTLRHRLKEYQVCLDILEAEITIEWGSSLSLMSVSVVVGGDSKVTSHQEAVKWRRRATQLKENRRDTHPQQLQSPHTPTRGRRLVTSSDGRLFDSPKSKFFDTHSDGVHLGCPRQFFDNSTLGAISVAVLNTASRGDSCSTDSPVCLLNLSLCPSICSLDHWGQGVLLKVSVTALI
uniref:Uncharacterized protein n=1 Tax=Paramormyrops kingsleyae TaxID=1676925 RepID=A0A3B3QEW9_9TELE